MRPLVLSEAHRGRLLLHSGGLCCGDWFTTETCPSCRLNEPLLPTASSPGHGPNTSKSGQALPRPTDVESAGRSAASLWSAARPVFEEPPTAFPQSSLWDTTVNLTNAVLGAGLLALPHAYAGLGVLGGVLLTAAVGLMTHASIALMLR